MIFTYQFFTGSFPYCWCHIGGGTLKIYVEVKLDIVLKNMVDGTRHDMGVWWLNDKWRWFFNNNKKEYAGKISYYDHS